MIGLMRAFQAGFFSVFAALILLCGVALVSVVVPSSANAFLAINQPVLPSSHNCSINAANKQGSGPDSAGSTESCLKVALTVGQNRNGSGVLAKGSKTNYLQIKVSSDSKLPEQSTPLYVRLPRLVKLGKLPSGLKSKQMTSPFEKSSTKPNSDGSSDLLVYGNIISRPGKSAAYSIPLQLTGQGKGVIEAGVQDPTGGEGQSAVQPLTWSPQGASRSYTPSEGSDQLVRQIATKIKVKNEVASKCPGEQALLNKVCPGVEALLDDPDTTPPDTTPPDTTPPDTTPPAFFLLSVSLAGDGAGSVTSSPTGISCPADCNKNFEPGTVVQLTALADPNSSFSHWTGACSNNKTSSCSLTISEALSTSAVFSAAALAGGAMHAASLVHAAATSCATGRMVYSNARGQVFPSQQLPVRAYDENNGTDDLLAQGLTDSEGRFRLCFDNADTALVGGANADLYLQFKTAVSQWEVVDDCCGHTGLTPFAYKFETTVRDNIPDGDINYGDLSAAPNRQRALHAFDTMRQAWQWTNAHSPAGTGSCWAMRPGNAGSIVGPRQTPDCNQKTVMWNAPGEGGLLPTSWPHYGGCMAAVAANIICLTPTAPDWPFDTLHELGHNLMQDVHSGTFSVPFTGLPPNDCPSPHGFGSEEDTGCAWTEGWASLFSWMVRDQALIGGGDAAINSETDYDLLSWQDYRGNNRGSNVESRVAGSLWDIADSSNEQPYDKLSVGTSALWNAFTSTPGRNFPDFLAILARNGAIDQSSQDYRSTLYGNTISFTPFSEPLASRWVSRPMPPVAAPSNYSNSSTGQTFKIDRPARISACPDLVLAQNIWRGVRPITAYRSSGFIYPAREDLMRNDLSGERLRQDWNRLYNYFRGPVRYNELENYRNSLTQTGPPSAEDPPGVWVGSQDFPYRFHLRSFEDQALQNMTANSGPDLNLFTAGNISVELPTQPRTSYIQAGGSVPADGRDGRALNIQEAITGQHVAGTVMPGFQTEEQANHYRIKLLPCDQLAAGANSQPEASVINSVALMQAGASYHITAAPSGTTKLAKGADLQLEIRALKDDCANKQSAENCDWKKSAAKKADRRKKGQAESITFIAPQTGLYRIYGTNKTKQAVPWRVTLTKSSG